MSTNTKERIVDAGATLFRRQGYSATGVKQIVTEAEAPIAVPLGVYLARKSVGPPPTRT